MTNFDDLLKDNIIDKSSLVKKRHEYLGLDAVQASFLSKIFIDNDKQYDKVNIEELSTLMNINVETAQEVVKPLITKGLVEVINEDNNTLFNFNGFINKLLSSYTAPTSDSTREQKVKWICKKVEFLVTDHNKSELFSVVESHDWNIIMNVISKFEEQKEQSFPLLVSFLQSALNKKEDKEKEIKSIMDVNWLE